MSDKFWLTEGLQGRRSWTDAEEHGPFDTKIEALNHAIKHFLCKELRYFVDLWQGPPYQGKPFRPDDDDGKRRLIAHLVKPIGETK